MGSSRCFFGSPEFQAHQSPPELESHQKLTEMKRNAMIVQEAKSLALTSSAYMESVRNTVLLFHKGLRASAPNKPRFVGELLYNSLTTLGLDACMEHLSI